MKWLILLAVIVAIAALLALDWRSSGRPRLNRSRRRGMTKTEQEAHQIDGIRNAKEHGGHGHGFTGM